MNSIKATDCILKCMNYMRYELYFKKTVKNKPSKTRKPNLCCYLAAFQDGTLVFLLKEGSFYVPEFCSHFSNSLIALIAINSSNSFQNRLLFCLTILSLPSHWMFPGNREDIFLSWIPKAQNIHSRCFSKYWLKERMWRNNCINNNNKGKSFSLG